jgi:G3E family GTPase
MIPLTVIGGYLGAGKTTLINALLAGDHGRRLAVLVNDFGAINIDARLIAAHDGDTLSLSNGCVCCTIADALGDALDKVLAMDPLPDQIIVEASGVANPAKIAMYGQGWPGLELDGVVVLVDGENIRALAADKFVANTIQLQLAGADLLLLNKTDLLTNDERDGVTSWLAARVAQVADSRIIPASFGDIPFSVLLGSGGVAKLGGTEDHGAYQSVEFRTRKALDRAQLLQQIANWPRAVLRAKGLVYLRDDPRRAYVLQLVGSRHELTAGPAWDGEVPETQLVMISAAGRINPDYLKTSLLSACG